MSTLTYTVTIDLRKIGRFVWQLLQGVFVGLIIFSPVILKAIGWIKG